jgi:hypothetical protein
MNSFTTQATANIGRNVNVNGVHHIITGLAEETGKMKNGDVAQYINMTADDGAVSTLHPRKASQLFSKGVIDGIQMLVDAVIEADAVEAIVLPTEIICYPTAKVKKEKKAKVVADPVAKEPSKKELAIAVYKQVMADDTIDIKAKRATVLGLFMSEVGLSKPGASTYFQSCKSGNYQ